MTKTLKSAINKSMFDENASLKGQVLIATPSIGDPRFHHAVILLCSHEESGAMGLVINNVLPGLSFDSMVEHFNVPQDENEDFRKIPLLGGGPLETSRGFVVHKTNFTLKDTINVSDVFSITGTIDALQAIAEGKGPDPFLFVLGYAGWMSGQLERELQDNVWLSVSADSALIFDVSAEQKWKMALAKLGIEPGFLSVQGGRA
jgi:putative transcriptional regulator